VDSPTAWLHPVSMLVGNFLLLLHPENRMLIMQQKLREHIRIPGEFSASGHNPTLKEAHRVHSRSERKVRWMESCYLVCKPTRLLTGTVPCFFFFFFTVQERINGSRYEC